MQQARVPGTLGTLRIAALLVLLSPMFPLITAAKTLMIFAPHPDDEALMASGIMYSALSRGDTVKVVVGRPRPALHSGPRVKEKRLPACLPLV